MLLSILYIIKPCVWFWDLSLAIYKYVDTFYTSLLKKSITAQSFLVVETLKYKYKCPKDIFLLKNLKKYWNISNTKSPSYILTFLDYQYHTVLMYNIIIHICNVRFIKILHFSFLFACFPRCRYAPTPWLKFHSRRGLRGRTLTRKLKLNATLKINATWVHTSINYIHLHIYHVNVAVSHT